MTHFRDGAAAMFTTADGLAGNDLSKRSFGLVGIAERTRLLNGKMRVESETGKGTVVIVEIDLS